MSRFLIVVIATLAIGGAAKAQTPAPAGVSSHNCPMMYDMMASAKSPSDKAMMQTIIAMHRSMSAMKFTGNADHDFLIMMIPHHQGAIDMANVELKYGTDPKVKALAKSIISSQQQQIDEMHAWLKKSM